ncbi:MAG: TrkH family potassium uptake protein, partial [Rhodospirillales bacterium]|nr:TrkH family potassium uptake protein [Rhodospirillales bacterium]
MADLGYATGTLKRGTRKRYRPIMDFRPSFLVVGMLLATLALTMLVPAAVDAFAGHADWQVFAMSAGVTLFVGVAMALTCRSGDMQLSIHQAFAMTTLSWLLLAAFATIPFVFSELRLSFTDAFFEAMSGFTTTGSTVIVGLDKAPPGILLWRSLLQWLGGLGIIVIAIAVLPMLRVGGVLPMLRVGGMQLFRMESSDRSEKALPRAAQIASAIGIIYVVLTGIIAIAYWLAGMSGFDAINHTMTTIATGGYSTHDNSIGHF